jgi:hypothetical protein
VLAWTFVELMMSFQSLVFLVMNEDPNLAPDERPILVLLNSPLTLGLVDYYE